MGGNVKRSLTAVTVTLCHRLGLGLALLAGLANALEALEAAVAPGLLLRLFFGRGLGGVLLRVNGREKGGRRKNINKHQFMHSCLLARARRQRVQSSAYHAQSLRFVASERLRAVSLR